MDLHKLRKELVGEELDYPFLLSHLREYAKPRDKISRFLRQGDLIRVKKGLYIFGEAYRKDLVSLEVLANLIYGPSYISLEYALSFYGLIPERVERITSMTTQKNKIFHTPLGVFSYQRLSLEKYILGIEQETIDGKRYFLIASPEKAIADVLEQHKTFENEDALLEFLVADQRIEKDRLKKLRTTELTALFKAYHNPSLKLLIKWIKDHA